MTFRIKADEVLKVIDPIIGVAGKDAEVTFNLAPTLIEVSIADESESVLCRMSADISEGLDSGSVLAYSVEEELAVAINVDRFTAAMKTFGSQVVDLSIFDRFIIIENDIGRRTIRTIPETKAKRDIKFKPSIEINASVADLKKITGFDQISESMFFQLRSGKLVIGCASDSETAEIYVDAGVYRDHRSFYSSEFLSDIVRRIHAEDDGVMISLADDAPLSLNFSCGFATFFIFVAPRIEEV